MENKKINGADAKPIKEIYRSDELLAILNEEIKHKPPPHLLSGIPKLDKYFTDFTAGELTIISGKTGHGKSTFCNTLTRNISETGHNVLWFSYDMTTIEFLKKTLDKNSMPPIFYLPKHLIANKISFVEHKIKECSKIVSPSAIFIDHLHRLCDTKNIGITIEIGRVMRWLKDIAKKYNLTIFLTAHIGKSINVKAINLDNDHLKDASAISQEADNVLFIIRDEKTDNMGLIKITKNRRNGYWNKYIPIVKVGNFFYELTKEEVVAKANALSES